MKIRAGFVSNSSSSSYVCQICGRSDSGWDASANDLGFFECVNGHLFCDDEILDHHSDKKEENEDEENKDEDSDDYIPEVGCPICQFQSSSKRDIAAYLLKKYGIPRDEVFAKVKENNKRRRKLYDVEYVNYVYEKFGLHENTVLSELKSQFGSYSEFLRST